MSTDYRVDTSALYEVCQDTRTAALRTPFSKISICGIRAKNPPPSPLGWLVHWRIEGYYWNLDGYEHTLIFDTNKDQTTHTVEVDVYHRPHGSSVNQQAGISFLVWRCLTGQDLIDMIERKNMHRYQYNHLGSGCLTWSRRIISELVGERYIQFNADYLVDECIIWTRQENNGLWVPDESGAYFI